MRVTEKEYKKMKKIATNTTKSKTVIKKNTKEEILPDWFDKDLKTSEASEEERKELDKIIDSMV